MSNFGSCKNRVWDVGDKTNCGRRAVVKDGEEPLCVKCVELRLKEYRKYYDGLKELIEKLEE